MVRNEVGAARAASGGTLRKGMGDEARDPGRRSIGSLEGAYDIPADIDRHDGELEELFLNGAEAVESAPA